MALNSKGTVPTMRDGPLVLNESNTIVSYICQTRGGGTGLYPQDPAALAKAWQWLEYAETTIVPAQNPVSPLPCPARSRRLRLVICSREAGPARCSDRRDTVPP